MHVSEYFSTVVLPEARLCYDKTNHNYTVIAKAISSSNAWDAMYSVAAASNVDIRREGMEHLRQALEIGSPDEAVSFVWGLRFKPAPFYSVLILERGGTVHSIASTAPPTVCMKIIQDALNELSKYKL
jgi:hypothetical protein